MRTLNDYPRHRGAAGLVLLGILLAPTAMAREVYTWVDGKGVTHFSDEPPSGRSRSAQAMELGWDPAPPSTLGSDYYSIRNQALRMEQQRLAAEQVRTARLMAERELHQAGAAGPGFTEGPDLDDDIVEGYGYYFPSRSHRRGGGYRPGRPGWRPKRGAYRRPVANRGGYNAINGYAPLTSKRVRASGRGHYRQSSHRPNRPGRR